LGTILKCISWKMFYYLLNHQGNPTWTSRTISCQLDNSGRQKDHRQYPKTPRTNREQPIRVLPH